MKQHNIHLVLIQIDEAHSEDAWPISVDALLDVHAVQSHKCFQDRMDRAKYFIETYKPPFDVYIDNWTNDYAETFRAWPDQYCCVKDLKMVAKSTYNKEGGVEATVDVDITDLIVQLIK